ncbi:MAG: PQQ-like beta-propeller repeat protein [Acidobacteriota bacterium]|nr:PQQ-like beta-propeller repeat protein [Acidobacteriota bacterium]
MKRTLFGLLVLTVSLLPAADKPTESNWLQWGGPSQDFRATATGLADAWPESGPKELWSRSLGDGYSGILYEAGKIYTMYRTGDNEVVLCANAKSGETIWEHAYASAPRDGHVTQFGIGPRSTPLIDGDRVYTIGIAGVMHALEKKTGKAIWSKDLWSEPFNGNFLNHGYSSSPIAYGDTIIALVGGEGTSVVAFDKDDGSVAWKNQSFGNSYSTPRIFTIDGEEQLITFMASEVVGLDPKNGDLKWRIPHENTWKQNVSMPVLSNDNVLFISAVEAGAKGIRLSVKDGKSTAEEAWSTRKIQFYHVTSVQDGDWVYGSTGMRTPAFMAAVNISTGEIGWRKRGYAKANVIAADGRLFVLDEDGVLSMTTATPEDLTMQAQTSLFDGVSWTVPTIIGATMYVRDQQKMVALSLK